MSSGEGSEGSDFLHFNAIETMYGRLKIDGIGKEEARFSFVAHEEYVNIHRSYYDEATAEYQQLSSIEVQGIGAFDGVLKKHEKSWC